MAVDPVTRGSADGGVNTAGTHPDVDDRRRAEEGMRSALEELMGFFGVAPDLLCITDFRGRFVRLNPAWEKVLGCGVSEAKGRLLLDMVHPEDRARTRCMLEDLARIPCEVEYASELRYRNPIIEDGTVVIAISQSGETARELKAILGTPVAATNGEDEPDWEDRLNEVM